MQSCAFQNTFYYVMIVYTAINPGLVSNSLGRLRRRWEDNIKMDLGEVGWGGADWVDLAQDGDRWRALVYTVMNLRVP